MGLLRAVVLGLVQGITAFLPISSTAHLRITPELVRMAEGLASERARAGRSIPEDIDFIRRGASPS